VISLVWEVMCVSREKGAKGEKAKGVRRVAHLAVLSNPSASNLCRPLCLTRNAFGELLSGFLARGMIGWVPAFVTV
jgi:hypothetical protein